MADELVLVDLHALEGLHDCGDGFTVLVVRYPHRNRVVHRLVGLEHLFDLFGVDLLAGGVDAHRPATEQGDAAVGLDGGVIAGYRVAIAVHLDEGRRGLLGVLVVPDGLVALDGYSADLARSRLDEAAVLGDHRGVAAELELGGARRAPGRRDRLAHPERLRRREGVYQQHAGLVREQPLLHRLAPHHTRGGDQHQARQVPLAGVVVEGPQHGLGEGIPHNRYGSDALALDGVEHLGHVEVAVDQCDDSPRGRQEHVGREPAGTVHERTGRDAAGAGGGDGIDCVVVGRAFGEDNRQAGAHGCPDEVVLAPHHPLWHSRGTAGVEHEDVVAVATPRRPDPLLSRGRRFLVGPGPVRARAAVVVDPQPRADVGELVADALDGVGEAAVEHHRHRVGVLPQIEQLVLLVPIVGVDRNQPRFEAGEDGLHVLRAVVEVQADLVLVLSAGGEESGGDAVSPSVELLPAAATLALDLSGGVRELVGDPLPQLGKVPTGHLVAPRGFPLLVRRGV
ncbi:MAG: hypothetical protein JJLCMIEE_02046 [Acidimicrobiales bacterium]|nr:hypothetical protein [Acidimicrobiales bacterium]